MGLRQCKVLKLLYNQNRTWPFAFGDVFVLKCSKDFPSTKSFPSCNHLPPCTGIIIIMCCSWQVGFHLTKVSRKREKNLILEVTFYLPLTTKGYLRTCLNKILAFLLIKMSEMNLICVHGPHYTLSFLLRSKINLNMNTAIFLFLLLSLHRDYQNISQASKY